MSNNVSSPKLHWYQTWYGLALVSAGVMLAIGLVAFAIIVGRYWWLIKHDRGQELFEKYNTQKTTQSSPALTVLRQRLELSDRPFLGSAQAPVVIVQFIDFKCQYCKQAMPIMYQVVNNFGKKVKVIFRHFPLDSIHPGATQLSEVAYCADKQGAFWPMYNVLFNNQDQLPESLTDSDIVSLAQKADISSSQLKSCLQDPATGLAVRTDFSDGVYANAGATPAYFVNGEKFEGVIPYQVWEGFLNNF